MQDGSKPNEDEQLDSTHDEQKEEVKNQFAEFWTKFIQFIRSVLDLRSGVDREATASGILHDVEFKGHASWILVCSVLIASIGLGENSIPVIVGAMLISPLMGPILGVGFAAGTNNFELLKKSLINFAVAIVISLVISTLYFLINPVFNVTPELESRKQAVLTAIAIAFLGGAAGIIAGSRSAKSNVVPGVAIATALMPPLCTAGYGLATWQGDYFFGAMYLFLINSVFIALPTYLYIRYMNFPFKEFVDPLRAKKIKRYTYIVILIIVVPSAIGFYQVITRSFFERNAKDFISTVKSELEGTGSRLIATETQYNDSLQSIHLDFSGKIIPDELQLSWKKRMANYNLGNARLEIYQNEDPAKALQAIQEQSKQDQRDLVTTIVELKDARIDSLEKELSKRTSQFVGKDYNAVARSTRLHFSELQRIGFSEQIEIDFTGKQDTICLVMIDWQEGMSNERMIQDEEKLKIWLMAKLDAMDVRLVHFDHEH
ncbi:MAG: DUF389 domain-containing protein [Flavobacteriales bacterium]|nr:DUF389 domain-containing protein [Flavobacteriales bacterium]